MEECSLDFLIGTDYMFYGRGGAGLGFFQQLKPDFLNKVKVFIFCNHKNYFYICYQLTSVSSNIFVI